MVNATAMATQKPKVYVVGVGMTKVLSNEIIIKKMIFSSLSNLDRCPVSIIPIWSKKQVMK
jgi:hypothetical protein